MTFRQSIHTCLKEKYFCFKGRATRSEFWFYFLFQFLVYTISSFVLGFIAAILDSETLFAIFNLLLIALWFYLFIPSIAVSARRLHDRNMSGWFMLINLIPLGSIIYLIFLVLPSKEGLNKFDIQD